MSVDALRMLVREEIQKLMQDDAVFRHKDAPGVLDSFDDPGDIDVIIDDIK